MKKKKVITEENIHDYHCFGSKASNLLSDKVRLKWVLACYDGPSSKSYFEMAIRTPNGLGSFVPVKFDYVFKLAKRIISSVTNKQAETEKSFLPEQIKLFPFNVLFISKDHEVIIFTEPKMSEREFFYKGDRKVLKNIPQLYYMIKRNSFSVFHENTIGKQKGFVRFNMPNISGFGSVCMQRPKIEEKMGISEIMMAFHETFWNSSFNSHADGTGFSWDDNKVFIYKQSKDLGIFKLESEVQDDD